MSEPVLVEDVLPEEEPVTVAEARAQCEAPAYEDSDVDPQDDAMFRIWIAAARQHCEEFTGLSFAPRVFSADFDAFPMGGYIRGGYPRRHPEYLELERGPVRWARIDYGDESDALSLEQDIGFRLDRGRAPNRLYAIDAWPYLTGYPGAVRVLYGAGYGVNTDANLPCPPAAKVAILMMVGYLYENRGNSTDAALAQVPAPVETLLRPLRVRLGMA